MIGKMFPPQIQAVHGERNTKTMTPFSLQSDLTKMHYLMSEADWMLWCLTPVAGFFLPAWCDHLSLQVRKATNPPANAIRMFQQNHWKHCSCLFSGVLLISHTSSNHKALPQCLWHNVLCCHRHVPAGCCSPPQQWLHLSSIYACKTLRLPLGRGKTIFSIFSYSSGACRISRGNRCPAGMARGELPGTPFCTLWMTVRWFPATNHWNLFCHPDRYCQPLYLLAFSSATEAAPWIWLWKVHRGGWDRPSGSSEGNKSCSPLTRGSEPKSMFKLVAAAPH